MCAGAVVGTMDLQKRHEQVERRRITAANLTTPRSSELPRVTTRTIPQSLLLALPISLALGYLAASGQEYTVPLILAVALASFAMTQSRPGPGLLLAAVLGVSIAVPLAAAALLFVGTCVLAARRTFTFHPVVLVGGPAALYLLLGAPNISSYRGSVDSSSIRLMARSWTDSSCTRSAKSPSRRTKLET